MKILDLLEAEFQTRKRKLQTKNNFKYDRDLEQSYRYENDPKSGAFGRVHDVSDPHMIRKIPHESTNSDPYYSYIEYVVNNKLAQSNPYFPRVYDLQKIEDSNGQFKYKIKLERLFKLRETDPDILLGFLRELFSKDMAELEQLRFDERMASKDFVTIITRKLCFLIRDVVERDKKSEDELLNSACKIVNKLFHELTNVQTDIHPSNIMVRMSPIPQLVIVDPLS